MRAAEEVYNNKNKLVGVGLVETNDDGERVLSVDDLFNYPYDVPSGGYELILNFSDSSMPASYFRLK